MGIWDDVTDIFSGGGRGDVNRGYDKANEYLDPYRKGGMEDYNKLREEMAKWGTDLGKYGNPGDWMYSNINQSPGQFYEKMMSGYSESPEAKYEQAQALKASGNAASMSGMLGSGAFMKGIQQNAADISNRDRDRYYNNIMGANNMQMGYLRNLQGEQDRRRQMMQYLTDLGFNAAGGMGQNEINRGIANAGFGRQTMEDIASMFGYGSGGSGGGLFGGGGSGKGGSGGSGGGGMKISPEQMQMLMMMFGG